jgi:fructan beta-fructosidase
MLRGGGLMSLRAGVFLGLAAVGLLGAQAAGWDQPYRPQFHFSPNKNWTNDPNGLVYFDGEYHLFFQYNPFGDLWGHMSWGHAVSRDLLHWQELPVALPEENGVMIFTGSTVVDERNSSGFCQGGRPCLVAVYTGHTPEHGGKPALQTQNIAYSNDRGRTWTKFAGNPVLNLNMSDFRDPKVFWSEQGKHWVMAVSLPNDHKIQIYGSPDLKAWKLLSDFGPQGAQGGQWECPELFQVPVEGSGKGERRWVLKVGLNPGALQGGSGEQYFVGQFDGTRFTNDNPPSTTLWTDYGKDCYCALTFNGLPQDRKPVMIGWMDNWQYADKLPTSPWRGQMTFPRALSLRQTSEGLRLYQEPVSLAPLAGKSEQARIKEDIQFPSETIGRSHTFVLDGQLDLRGTDVAGWKLLADANHFTTIVYKKGEKKLVIDRSQSGLTNFSPKFPAVVEAPLAIEGDALKLKAIVDRCSLEVFADDGRIVSTNLVFPPADAGAIHSYSIGQLGHATARITEIKSAH